MEKEIELGSFYLKFTDNLKMKIFNENIKNKDNTRN